MASDDDSYSSVSSHQEEEAEETNWSCREESKEAGSVVDEKNMEGVGVRPAAMRKKTVSRKRKRTCHKKYQQSIRNLKNCASWL